MALYNALAVAGTAVPIVDGTTITAALVAPYGAKVRAHVKIETAPVRVRVDGTAPTSSVGTPFDAGQEFTLSGVAEVLGCKIIRTTGTSAVAHVTVYRED